MKCNKCGFDMTAKVIDAGITIYKCPLGHKKTIFTDRPSATRPARQRVAVESTYPNNLGHK
jgi:hypothetical protein